MLFIGVQFIVWAFSGAYMVVMDIDYIHGDSLLAKQNEHIESKQVNYSVKQLLNAYPEAKNIQLAMMLEQPVYHFKIANKAQLVSAKNGKFLSPISKTLAVEIAKQAYVNKNITVYAVSLISEQTSREQTSRELSVRNLPVWRIDFDDFASPTLYISVNSGKLVTKRHSFWRFFDWMFAFHVMDYIDESADNNLLLVFTLLALLASIFGLVLTYFRTIKVGGKTKPKAKRKDGSKSRAKVKPTVKARNKLPIVDIVKKVNDD